MARVKIKTANSKTQERKNKLLEILSSNNIYVTKIIPVNDGFIILTNDDNELDKLFNNKTNVELENQEFNPLIPPQLQANRSIIIFDVDNHIYKKEEERIKQELLEKN